MTAQIDNRALDTPRRAASPLPAPTAANSAINSTEDRTTFARAGGGQARRRGAAAALGVGGLSAGLPSVVGTAVGETSPTKFFEEARSRTFLRMLCPRAL